MIPTNGESTWSSFLKGLWEENPVFRMLIGMCPTLAVTTSATNGFAMGAAASFVLICSSTMISLLKNVIPRKVRIPCYIIIIATFVTVVDLMLAAMVPQIHKVLGLFIPLIVVNCLILGRAEAWASRNPVGSSILDAVGMGLGFTWGLVVLGAVRELIGSGTVFGLNVFGEAYTGWVIMILPPGAFITMGGLVAAVNLTSSYMEKKRSARMSSAVSSQAGGEM